jgi:hypothetical protein
MARKHNLPAVCIDENLSPLLATVFREVGYRVYEAAKDPRLHARDEREFLSELYSRNAIFVTADTTFVNELVDAPRRHAGIVYIPQGLLADEKDLLAFMAAHFVLGRCAESSLAFRGRIFYIAHDGIRLIHRGKDLLDISWARLRHLTDAPHTAVVRRKRRSGRGPVRLHGGRRAV